MAFFKSKADFYLQNNQSGYVPNGTSHIPGNGYYSIEEKAPQLNYDHYSNISNERFHHSKSHHIDPIHSLLSLKQETSLTKYYHHNPPVEQCRDRFIFVPKYLPREEPNEYKEHDGLNHLKALAQDTREYRLNEIPKLPDMDTHVLPKERLDEEAYRIYGAKQPYDMTVLRDTKMFNPPENQNLRDSNQNFISVTTLKRL